MGTWCACKLYAKDSGINFINFFIHLGVIPLVIQDANPVKEFLIEKLNPMDYIWGVSFTDYHQ